MSLGVRPNKDRVFGSLCRTGKAEPELKCSDQNRAANLERKVEPMTLQAFIKEHLAAGKDIPLDIFGVYRQRIAKVEV